jgi:DNA polymerase V
MLETQLKFYKVKKSDPILLPFFGKSAPCSSFPSAAIDYFEEVIDLKAELIKDEEATFVVVAVGDSMIHDGIEKGDILIIDRSLELVVNKIALFWMGSSFTVKRYGIIDGQPVLIPGNPEHPIIKVDETVRFWGRVTKIIKNCV